MGVFERKVRELRCVRRLLHRRMVRMFQAALWDNVELLEDLLQEEVHLIDCLDSWGRAPIHAAAITADSRCLPMLLNAGANVNATSGPRCDHKVRSITDHATPYMRQLDVCSFFFLSSTAHLHPLKPSPSISPRLPST